MTFALRPYQQRMIEQTRLALRSNRAVLVQSPTGSGKTALAAFMLGTSAAKGAQSLFIVHRQELIDQSIATFAEVGIEHGIIAAGHTPNPYHQVQLCSVDTLKARLSAKRLRVSPRLVVWDESHHIAAAGWARVMAAFPTALHIGLSATPERLDGKGLDGHFQAIVHGPSVAWLIEQHFLAAYRAFAPTAPDLSGMHTRMGDYVKAEAEAAMDKPSITGDAIRHYQRLARGKRAVAFCVSVAHSQRLAADFRAAGVTAWHVDGNSPTGERRQAVAAFRAGEIQVLTNVDLFGEGFDLPAMDAAILLRPTQSLGLHLQQCGRALRPAPGKHEALILDHAGNLMRHGLPDDEREWTLAGRERRGKDGDTGPAMRRCPRCFMVHRPAPACPACGHVYEMVGRKVETKEGDLQEVDAAQLRGQRKCEQAMARTVEELTAVGRARGYEHPERWARYVWNARRQSGRAA